MADATQRTVLFWDVLRQRSDQYYAQKAKEVPHVLSFEAELVLDGRTFARPVNYLLVRVKPPAGRRRRPAASAPSWWSIRAPGTAPASAASRPTARSAWPCAPAIPCYFVGFTPEPMPGQTIEDIMRGRGDVPGEGDRAAPAGRRQALRHRQLPGRLGGDDGRRDPARSCSARSSSPARRCPTGPACRARTRCATPAAWPAAVG